MAKKKVVIKKLSFTKPNENDVLAEIKAVRDVIDIKKNQTTSSVTDEKLAELENNEKVNLENTENVNTETTNDTATEIVNSNETVTETLDVAEPKKKSILSDMANFITQEDLDKKQTATETISDTQPKTNIEERLESAGIDDFSLNEGATEEEDTPEHRREMAKIKASALVEFFDVIFMLICLGISKDFSDNAQTKFSLVKERKNAIKANVFQILAFSKKKHNPMGTVIFLILFSYVPLIAIAIMQRVKRKKEEQQKLIEQSEMINLETPIINSPSFNTPQFEPPIKKKYTTNKIKTVHAETNQEVKQMKDGSYKNVVTGQIYSGGRGRKPSWVKKYIGKIG